MKVLIIPDVHGRNFWRDPCSNPDKWDKIIFLGDYVDPYPGEATKEETVQELKDIVAFKEIYKDKVTLLLGNHDLFYCCEPYRKQLDYWSRHDYARHVEIESIFTQASELFQFADQVDNFLFTHAGVSNGLAKYLNSNYELDNFNAEELNKFFKDEKNQGVLSMCSYYRGGPYSFSSIVWADVHEHWNNVPNKFIKDFFQIFGHTYCKTYIKNKNFAMLDCGGAWFVLEDGILYNARMDKLVDTHD